MFKMIHLKANWDSWKRYCASLEARVSSLDKYLWPKIQTPDRQGPWQSGPHRPFCLPPTAPPHTPQSPGHLDSRHCHTGQLLPGLCGPAHALASRAPRSARWQPPPHRPPGGSNTTFHIKLLWQLLTGTTWEITRRPENSLGFGTRRPRFKSCLQLLMLDKLPNSS